MSTSLMYLVTRRLSWSGVIGRPVLSRVYLPCKLVSQTSSDQGRSTAKQKGPEVKTSGPFLRLERHF
jgi:hypothetical protein